MEGSLSRTDRNVPSQLCHACQSKHVTFRENICLLKALVDFQLGCHGNGNHRAERKGSISDVDVDWPKKKIETVLSEVVDILWRTIGCVRRMFQTDVSFMYCVSHISIALYATLFHDMTSAVLKSLMPQRRVYHSARHCDTVLHRDSF